MPSRTIRQVPIITARDSDMPEALRPTEIWQSGNPDSWYHNSTPSFQVKRAPSLSFLLLSRGLPGAVANMVLTTIEEDAEDTGQRERGDIVTTAKRVQMGDFEVVKPLGAGSYAPVFQVKKTSTGELFAMKRLVKHNYVQRLAVEGELPRRERDTLRMSGRHPNVAYLECAFDTDTYWVLVTEFCNLGSLTKYIRSKRRSDPGLEPAEAARLTGGMLQGLAHVHGADIMHRDIKPDNIGVSSSDAGPVAKLIDFGFAKRADARQSRTIVGSYGYCAPEIDHARQLFGALRQAAIAYDERVDLYSFGIVVFVAVIGREADVGGNLWTHRQFRQMLMDSEHVLWRCARYQRVGLTGPACRQKLIDCGALKTIRVLTATDPKDRPRNAVAAGSLPLFTRNPGCVPAEWTVEPSATDGPPESWGTNAPDSPPESWDPVGVELSGDRERSPPAPRRPVG